VDRISDQGPITKKARSSPAAAYFLPSVTQPINLEYKLIEHPNETKYNPNNSVHLNFASNNLIIFTLQNNWQ
jgi:hypothetical protein